MCMAYSPIFGTYVRNSAEVLAAAISKRKSFHPASMASLLLQIDGVGSIFELTPHRKLIRSASEMQLNQKHKAFLLSNAASEAAGIEYQLHGDDGFRYERSYSGPFVPVTVPGSLAKLASSDFKCRLSSPSSWSSDASESEVLQHGVRALAAASLRRAARGAIAAW